MCNSAKKKKIMHVPQAAAAAANTDKKNQNEIEKPEFVGQSWSSAVGNRLHYWSLTQLNLPGQNYIID